MIDTAEHLPARASFSDLMKAGRQAYDRGDTTAAHDFWRQAAVLNPYEEKVWLALYRVVDTDEDRRTCLENIIAINPANVRARRRLRAFGNVGRRVNKELQQFKQREKRRYRRGFLLSYLLLALMMAGLVALLDYLVTIGT